MQPFHLESVTVGGDCAVLRVAGEVDVFTAPQLRERVIQLVANGVRHIVADLREVEFMDSTGLGALVGALKRLRAEGGSLRLAASGKRVLTVFQLTGLVNAFALHPTVSDAIAADEHFAAALAREGHDRDEWCRKHGLA